MGVQNKSLYTDIVDYYFNPAVQAIVNTINGEPEEKKLLVQKMFKKAYTPTLDWESISADKSVVAADIVSMNATIPLKNRGIIKTAKGEIPKMGLKYGLQESDMKRINIMLAMGRPKADVAKEVLNDSARCVMGILHRLEIQAMQGLSAGVVGLSPEQEGGTMVRLTYGAVAENTVKAKVLWNDPTRTPVSDIKAMFDKASDAGKPIRHVLIAKSSVDAIASSDEGKQLYAKNAGAVVTDKALLATPNRKQMADALATEFEATFEVIDTNLFYEDLSGKKVKAENAWANGAVVGLPSSDFAGKLWWTELAEVGFPVQNVNYATANDFILVSKFSSTEPLQEFTKGEAMAIPVLDNVDGIFRLNTL